MEERQMTGGDGPSKRLPSVLVTISRADQEREHQLGDKKYAIHAPGGVEKVIIDPYVLPENPRIAELVRKGALQSGAVLVLSPFNTGTYAEEFEAFRVFEREKIALVAELCRLLGASQVETVLRTLNAEADARSLDLSGVKKAGRANLFTGKAQITVKEYQELSQELKASFTYKGGAPDTQAAEEFMTTHRLNDPEIRALLSARSGSNMATSHTVHVEYQTINDSSMELAGQVRMPAAFGAGRYTKTRRLKNRLSIDLAVQFPPEA